VVLEQQGKEITAVMAVPSYSTVAAVAAVLAQLVQTAPLLVAALAAPVQRLVFQGPA
jgi:hypothetical protein